MNRDETWALFQQGRDAWNVWAAEMLSKRQRSVEAGESEQSAADWNEEARTDFSDRKFDGEADFVRFIFPGDADFGGADFRADALFVFAEFRADTSFLASKFQAAAKFQEAKFNGFTEFGASKFTLKAEFQETRFEELVEFRDASFSGGINFREANFADIASFDRAKFGNSVLCSKAKFIGATSFHEVRFGGSANFEQSKFLANLSFVDATFEQDAKFRNVEFGGEVRFTLAKFKRAARFDKATFDGRAGFDQATFQGLSWFSKCKFRAEVGFVQADFEGYTVFQNAVFARLSKFSAIRVERAFTLAGATFHQAPDFIQANFAQAPRLDDLSIEPQSLQRLVWLVGLHLWRRRELGKQRRVLGAAWRVFRRSARNWQPFSREVEREAKWRSVKKLANEAHDHAREQEFFAEELKARRNARSLKEAFIWLVSLLYQGLSNFGRSLLLPFIWLAVTVMAFEGIYLNSHWDYVADKQAAVQACVVGSEHSHAESAAFALSLRNTLPFAGLGGPEKLNQIYRCLYGVEGTKTAGFPETRLPPHIPDNVAVWSFFQTILSAVLIFLFLLALRNHFRIK